MKLLSAVREGNMIITAIIVITFLVLNHDSNTADTNNKLIV